jgi:hypothetical protein
MGFVIIQPPGDGVPNDGPEAAYVNLVAENYSGVDDTQLRISRVATLLEAMLAADTIEQQLTIAIEVSDAYAAGASIELTRQLLTDIGEDVYIYGLFKTISYDANGAVISDGAQTWVMNTEGSLPLSEYDNYNFNSLTQFKGVSYGANDAGLHTLSGDNDEGAPITSELSSMMLDMGTSRMKRIRTAYLGYTAGGDLVLKVRSVSDGSLSEHWYKAREATAAEAPREGYVKVGQGLKSRYWQFELTNMDGADFEIDQLELYPLFLGRRV